jgi:hypothetical protein
VRFELTDQTRQAIDEYLRLTESKAGQFSFAGRGDRGGLTTRQYARLVLRGADGASMTPPLRRTTGRLSARLLFALALCPSSTSATNPYVASKF